MQSANFAWNYLSNWIFSGSTNCAVCTEVSFWTIFVENAPKALYTNIWLSFTFLSSPSWCIMLSSDNLVIWYAIRKVCICKGECWQLSILSVIEAHLLMWHIICMFKLKRIRDTIVIRHSNLVDNIMSVLSIVDIISWGYTGKRGNLREQCVLESLINI